MAPIVLDLSSLPENARIELADFYEFLKRKYVQVQNDRSASVEALFNLNVEPFVPLSREGAHAR
jgi:hypothetical protein